MTGRIANLLNSSRLIVCLGAGGVGKTTTAVATAVAAARAGRRTALISVDPAKRLAAAMNIKLSHNLEAVNFDGIAPDMLYATMLDQKSVFDEMVKLFTRDEKTKARILNHRLYQACSANFGGAVEYMALALLNKLLKDERFDLVVLDTPPDAHALDFLARPNILAGFMENRVMTWVIKPFHLAQKLGLGKVFSLGERLAGGIAEVTGIKALQTLAEFLVLMQDTFAGFHAAGQNLQKTLQSPATKYIVVATPRSAPLRSAQSMVRQMAAMNLSVEVILINRCLPQAIKDSIALNGSAIPEASKFWLSPLAKIAEAEDDLVSSFREQLEKVTDKSVNYQRLVECSEDMQSLKGILYLSSQL